jgi:predicted metal-dependent peptidase
MASWIQKSVEREIEKGHITLMQHPKTGFYAGVMLLGKSEVRDDIPTACTDGLHTFYGRGFIKDKIASAAQLRFLIMHETKHKADKHMFRFKDLMKEDAQLANASMDYAINDEIKCIDDNKLVEMPEGGLYDPKFHLWSVREIYRFLKTGQEKNQPNKPRKGKAGCMGGPPQRNSEKGTVKIDGKEYSIGRMDEHSEGLSELSPEERKEIEGKIDKAIQDGGFLAGVNKVNLPRGLLEALTPEIDWKAEFMDFVTSHVKGNDEYTWRRFDRRRVADEVYIPGTYSEKMTELVVAADLSGSIGDKQMAEWFGALYAAVQSCRPDIVRVLWWDMDVNAEQIFHEDSYDSLLSLLKPRGGGGTHVGCVSKYMVDNKINPDCVVVFTDGYVEHNPVWEIECPTLWLVTENDSFEPPKGQKVKVNARG